jgi:hypothetical protein
LEHLYKKPLFRGSVNNFVVTVDEDIGNVDQIKLRMQLHGFFTKWKLEKIVVVHMATSKEFVFLADSWFDGCNSLQTFQRIFEPIENIK